MFCEASTRESDSDLIDGSEANKQFGKMVNGHFWFVVAAMSGPPVLMPMP